MNRSSSKTRAARAKARNSALNAKEPGSPSCDPGSVFTAGTFGAVVHDSALGAGEGISEHQPGPVEERLVGPVQRRLPVGAPAGPVLPGPGRMLVPHQPGQPTPRAERGGLDPFGHSVSFHICASTKSRI